MRSVDLSWVTFNFAKIKQIKIKFILDTHLGLMTFSLRLSKYLKGLA